MQKRNSAISILRVMAMSLIIFTHLCHLYNWVAIRALVFGVPLFLCISGYLYGKRIITDWKKFFIGRVEKILLPVWIFAAFVMIYSSVFLTDKPSFLDVALQVLNLQGINNFLSFIPVSPFGDCANLWFMTIIMLCYFSLPLVQFIFNKSKAFWIVLALLTISIIAEFIGIGLLYFCTFWVGYYVAKIEDKKTINIKTVLVVGVICFALWIIRILTRPYIDGTVLYNKVIANLSLDLLAFFVFVLFLYLYPRMLKIFDFIAQSKVFQWIDAISIYVYIVHRLFYAGFWNVTYITSDLLLQTLLVIIFSILLAIVLKFVCEKLQKIIFHTNLRTKDV